MALIGILCVPFMIVGILVYGIVKRVKVYDVFMEGAKEGLCTMYKIFPALLGLIVSVGLLRVSGVFEWLVNFLRPVTSFLGFPGELIPLMLMRPISGSGALAVLTDIFETYSPDSFVGKCASVMMGSTETTFYTIAIYYGATGITKIRHTAKAALVADLVGMVGAVIAVQLILR